MAGQTRWLDRPLDTVTTFWRLYRRDGVALGLTSHDRDLAFGGMVHRAAPGMLPSAIELDDGLDADTMDVSGALTHDMIRPRDLRGGRWDDAALVMGVVRWDAPEAGEHILFRGRMGSVEFDEDGFRVELQSAKSVLDAPVAPATSPTCRAALGGPGCGLGLHRFTRDAVVAATGEDGILFAGLGAAEAADYGFGQIRWTDGDNAGLSASIWMANGAAIVADRDFPNTSQPGDRATLTQGCDKRLATCADRFGNVVNYQGEPYLPGNDLLTRYPGG